MPNSTPTSPSHPEDWHRTICFAHERLIVTGDLTPHLTEQREQLLEWIDAGVTHIVDVRGEWNDAALVRRVAPQLTYLWVGTHDAGGRQSDSWFDLVLADLGAAIHDDDATLLVHCHMGVNRAPSMALRIMLEQGWDAVDALAAIRAARPIAAVLYAEDAVDHFHRRHGSSDTARYADRRRVRAWLADHDLDVGWVISRIRRAE